MDLDNDLTLELRKNFFNKECVYYRTHFEESFHLIKYGLDLNHAVKEIFERLYPEVSELKEFLELIPFRETILFELFNGPDGSYYGSFLVTPKSHSHGRCSGLSLDRDWETTQETP